MTTATAPHPEPHLADHQASYELVALELLYEAPYNPRTSFEDLEGLAASIRTDGVLEPLLVRDRPRARKKSKGDPHGKGQLEIMAGARRLRAAKLAGLESVPVIRLDVGDAAARRICAAENLQRAELHPLEEARAIANLVADFGVVAAAEQLGKTDRYVARRANLLRLSPKWQRAVEKGRTSASKYPPSFLELIALCGKKDQDELLQQLGVAVGGNVPDAGYLERVVANRLRLLKLATWKLEDAELVPKQGACSGCSRHSAALPGLFEDQVKGDLGTATCQDDPCWREKTTAVAKQKLAVARKEHGAKLLLVTGSWDGDRRKGNQQNPLGKPSLRDYDYQTVKKSTKGAVPAFVVEGKGVGSVRFILKGGSRAPGLKTKRAKKVEPGTAEDLKAKRERLQRRRDAFKIDWIRELLEGTEAPPQPLTGLPPLFLAYGIPEAARTGSWRTTEFAGRKKTADGYAFGQLWIALRGRLVSSITRSASGALTVQLKEARWLLEQLWPVTAKKTLVNLVMLAADKIPKPKGLAALERRGTKKAAPKKKAARKKAKKKASSRGPRAAKKKAAKKKGRKPRKG